MLLNILAEASGGSIWETLGNEQTRVFKSIARGI